MKLKNKLRALWLCLLLVGCSGQSLETTDTLGSKKLLLDAKIYAFPQIALLSSPKVASDSGEFIYAFRNEFDADGKTLIEIDAISQELFKDDSVLEIVLSNDDNELLIGILEESNELNDFGTLAYESNDSTNQFDSISIKENDTVIYKAAFEKNPNIPPSIDN